MPTRLVPQVALTEQFAVGGKKTTLRCWTDAFESLTNFRHVLHDVQHVCVHPHRMNFP